MRLDSRDDPARCRNTNSGELPGGTRRDFRAFTQFARMADLPQPVSPTSTMGGLATPIPWSNPHTHNEPGKG